MAAPIALVAFVLVLLVPAAALVIGGIGVSRRAAVNRQDRQYVPITANVVEYHGRQRPETVLFDYPAPDGSWLRAKRVVGIGALPSQVGPGTPITVWVDPRNPADVRFSGAGSAPGLGGAVMVGVGILLGTFALGLGLVLITATSR